MHSQQRTTGSSNYPLVIQHSCGKNTIWQFDQVRNLLFLINYCRVSGGVCLFHVSLWDPLNVKALCVGGRPGKPGLMRSHLGRPPAASSAKLKNIFPGYPCCQPPFAFFFMFGNFAASHVWFFTEGSQATTIRRQELPAKSNSLRCHGTWNHEMLAGKS